MKLYKEVKRNRLPKEVLILIDILNNHSSDRHEFDIASMGVNLFYIKHNVITPLYYNFSYFYLLSGISRKYQYELIELAIKNSKYSEYDIIN